MDDQVIDGREIHEVIQQSKWERSIEGQTWEAPEQNLVLLLTVTVSNTFSKRLLPVVLEQALSCTGTAPASRTWQRVALHLAVESGG